MNINSNLFSEYQKITGHIYKSFQADMATSSQNPSSRSKKWLHVVYHPFLRAMGQWWPSNKNIKLKIQLAWWSWWWWWWGWGWKTTTHPSTCISTTWIPMSAFVWYSWNDSNYKVRIGTVYFTIDRFLWYSAYAFTVFSLFPFFSR